MPPNMAAAIAAAMFSWPGKPCIGGGGKGRGGGGRETGAKDDVGREE